MMRGFDSIESMNADELLVKRERGSKRFLAAAGIIGGLFFLIGILVGYFSHNTSKTTPKPNPTPVLIQVDDYIMKRVSGDFLKKTIRDFSSKPRISGTKDNHDLAQTIQSLWISYGVENVHLETYHALLSFSNESEPNKVEVFNTNTSESISATLPFEPALRPNDVKSTTPSYNAYSPAGNVSGHVVYVNYGRIVDLQYLTNNLSIDLSGKILLVRMGKIFRWIKVQNAERFNASAVILYSDPADINVSKKENVTPYPDSWWMPENGLQQGTLLEPEGLTNGLGYPATDGVEENMLQFDVSLTWLGGNHEMTVKEGQVSHWWDICEFNAPTKDA